MRHAARFGTIAAALLASACGGGGGGGGDGGGPAVPARSTAEGQWSGSFSINGGASRAFDGVVLSDGSYWFTYAVAGSPTLPIGFVRGAGASAGSAFTSGNGVDYNFGAGAGTGDFTLTGSFTGSSLLSGALVYAPNSSASFVTNYLNNYDAVPSLAALAGSYAGDGAFGSRTSTPIFTPFSIVTSMTIDAGGAINGSFAGNGSTCPYTGTATPRSVGNVYDVTLTAGSPCFSPSTSVSGVGVFDSGTRVLRMMAASTIDAQRAIGVTLRVDRQ